MGGDPWSSGSHLEAPNLAMAQIEGDAPVELLIRSKRYFELMEPVIVELRLRNLMTDIPIVIDKRLAPEFGGVVVYIQKPDGAVVKYEPIMCALGTPEAQRLSPYKAGEEGDDRYSRFFLSYGANGFYFDQPGEYRIRATYQGFGGHLDTVKRTSYSNRRATFEGRRSSGSRLLLGRGWIEPLSSGFTSTLQRAWTSWRSSPTASRIRCWGRISPWRWPTGRRGRSFESTRSPGTRKMLQTAKADPARALKLTDRLGSAAGAEG